MNRLTIGAMIVGLLFSSAVLPAQESSSSPYREGFWIGFGFGPGHAQIDCSACGPRAAGDPWDGGSGMTVYVAAGGTARPNLLVGGEVNQYLKESNSSEREASLASASLVAQYYPVKESRVFVRGGAGFGHYSLVSYYYLDSFMGRTSAGLSSFGYAVQAGVGYDLVLGRRLALVPFANGVQIFAEGERDSMTGAAVAPSNPRFVHLGIGLHWY